MSVRLGGLTRWVPGVETARHYHRRWLAPDLLAGLALTALLVPHGMAYAELAGLPAVTGLYTTVAALGAYALFGPSKILVLGPDSSLAPLIFASITPLLAADDTAEAVALAAALAILVGLMCLATGLLRMGAIAELLSKPVLVGYLNGLALIVIVSQLPKLFGFSVEADGFFPELRAFLEGVSDGLTEPTALAIGVGSLVVILGFRRLAPRIPGVLVASVGAALLVGIAGLSGDIAVVGDIPEGFPSPTLPDVDIEEIAALLIGAAGIALMTLADTTALSKAVAAQRGEEVDPDQELVALGAANIAAGLFRGFPVSASTSRTGVATSTGAKSQLAAVVGAMLILAILVFASGLMADLPSTTLAAIVIAAGLALLDLDSVRWLWRVRRSEFALTVATTAGVLVFGVLAGIVLAVFLSLANFVRRARRPHDALLGRVERRKGYHDQKRHPDARLPKGLVMYRFDAPLFFGNADYFRRRVRDIVVADRGADNRTRWLAIAAEPMTDIDTSGAEVLTALLDELDEADIRLVFAELKGPTKDRLRRYGLYDRIGDEYFFPTVGRVIGQYVKETDTDWTDWTDR